MRSVQSPILATSISLPLSSKAAGMKTSSAARRSLPERIALSPSLRLGRIICKPRYGGHDQRALVSTAAACIF